MNYDILLGILIGFVVTVAIGHYFIAPVLDDYKQHLEQDLKQHNKSLQPDLHTTQIRRTQSLGGGKPMPEVKLKFEPRDIWVGIYWNLSRSIESAYRKLDVYICVVPMLPIRLRFEWGWR